MEKDDIRPVAEGNVGDLWIVAYRSGEATDVLSFRFQRVGEKTSKTGATATPGVALGKCAWAARLRGSRWVSTTGEPSDRTLEAVAKWIAKETKHG